MWEEAREEIRRSSAESSIYIGCDSIRYKKNGDWYARYSTVIVVHKDTSKGCKIFYHSESLRDYGKGIEGLRNRLLTEVNFAVQASMAIADVVGDRHLELHIDVNPDPIHKSNIVSKEALGWVRGMGLDAKIKPDSWAATHAADHCVRFKTFAN